MVAVWTRRREIEFRREAAFLHATMDDKKQATEMFNTARELEFPSGGNIRKLSRTEKDMMSQFKTMAGKAFKIKVHPSHARRRIRSRLAEARRSSADEKGKSRRLEN